MDARPTRASRPSTWSARNPMQILHDRHRQVLHDRHRYHRHNLHQRQDYDTATARRPSPWPEALRCDSGQCDRLVVSGASPPNIGLSTEPKRLQWWCSQLSSNVFHFREHNQRSNPTYSLPWPQAVNIRCARYHQRPRGRITWPEAVLYLSTRTISNGSSSLLIASASSVSSSKQGLPRGGAF